MATPIGEIRWGFVVSALQPAAPGNVRCKTLWLFVLQRKSSRLQQKTVDLCTGCCNTTSPMITPTTITKEQLQKEKQFLIKRITTGTSIKSILDELHSCHITREAHNFNSCNTTSLRRLSNIIKYEILQNILSDKTEKIEMIQNKITGLENEIEYLKKLLSY